MSWVSSPKGRRHCHSEHIRCAQCKLREAISTHRLGDCFVAVRAPRNDRLGLSHNEWCERTKDDRSRKKKRAIPQWDSPSIALYQLVGYSLVLQRRVAYPARPARPLPRSIMVPGSGTNSSSTTSQVSARTKLTEAGITSGTSGSPESCCQKSTPQWPNTKG